jgi:N-dimethylarginine dimethylaminohydrolase
MPSPEAKKSLVKPKQATAHPSPKPTPNVKLWSPSQLDVPAYMMNFPFTWDTDAPNNAWMTGMSAKELDENWQKAYQQWMDLYNLMAGEALVYVMPSDGDFGDQVYVANIGIILNHLPKPVAVVANFKSPPRKGEEGPGRKIFTMMGYPVKRPILTWEGEADLKHVRDNIYVGGYGIRTDPQVYDWFEREFDMKIIRVKMTDDKLYHFDCEFFPLTAEKSLVCTSIMEKSEITQIEKVCEIIPVSLKLAHAGTTNSVRLVNNVICGSSLKALGPKDKDYDDEVQKENFLRMVCAKNGMEPIFCNISEFEKSGAATSCLVCHLNRAAYSQPLI